MPYNRRRMGRRAWLTGTGDGARVAITVKAPADLHEGLRRWAAQEERSLAGQVLFILRRALAERNQSEQAAQGERGGASPAPGDPGAQAPGALGGERPG